MPTKRLEDVFGPAPGATQTPSPTYKKPSSTPMPTTTTTNKPAMSIEDAFGPMSVRGYKSEGLQYDWLYRLNPWYKPADSVNNISTFDQNVMSASSNFLQGFVWGTDVVHGEEQLTKANKTLGAVSSLAGDLTRTAGEVVLSGGIVTGLSKAARATYWGAKALEAAPAALKATEAFAPQLLKAAGNGAARGLVYSGIEQAFAPEDDKPGLQGTLVNTMAFAGGHVGNELTQKLLNKYVVAPGKKVSPLFQQMLTSIGDTVGGMVASFPFVEDKSRYLEDFGGQVVVTGVMDTIMYGLTKKHIEANKEVRFYAGIAERAAQEFYNTGSEASAQAFYDATERVLKAGVRNQKTAWIEQLFEQFDKDRRQGVVDHGGKKNMNKPLTTSSVDPDQQRVDKLAQNLVQKKNRLTSDELDKLANHTKPSNGDSINTGRIAASGEIRDTVLTIADAQQRRPVQPHKEVLANAKKLLPEEERHIKEIVAEFGAIGQEAKQLEELTRNAPEIMTKWRAIMVSNAVEIRKVAKKIHNTPAAITDLDLAQFMYRVKIQDDITGSIKGIWNNFGRTLSSGNIDVGGKLINLADIFPEDLINDVDLNNTIEGIIHGAGGKETIRKLATTVVTAPDLGALNQRARKGVRTKPIIRAIVEGRTASLLTSPFTSAYNLLSQGTNQALEHLTELTSVGVGNTIDLFTGDKTAMSLSEFGARVKGDAEGILIRSFLRPIVSAKDVNFDLNLASKTPLEFAVKLLESPMQLEKLLNETSLNPRQQVEGMPITALSTDAFKGTKLGTAIDSVGQGLDKVRGLVLKLTGKDINTDPNSVTMVDLVNGLLDAGFSAQRLMSFGLLEMGDRPFANGAYFSELAGSLEGMGKTQGLKGQALKEWKDRMEQQVTDMRKYKSLKKTQPGVELPLSLKGVEDAKLKVIHELDEQAFSKSNYMTWKDEFTNDIAQKVEQAIHQVPEVRFIIPFYHTPMKILSKSLAYTPGLNLFAQSIRKDISGANGNRARDMAYSRMLVGGTLYFIGWTLATSNFITPNAPTPHQKQAMKEDNIPTGAVYVPAMKRWVPTNRIDPAPSTFFNTMGELYNIMKNPEINKDEAGDIATVVMLSFARQSLDKTWLKGVNDTLNAIFGRGSKGWSARLADTFVPFYGARQAAPQIHAWGLNPMYKENFQEVNSFLDRFQSTNDALDSYGKPIANQERWGGIQVGKSNASPIRKVAIALGIQIPQIGDTVRGTKITPEERRAIITTLDTDLHMEDKLNDLVQSEDFMKFNDRPKVQVRILDKHFSAYIKRAKGMYIRNHPELWQRIRDNKKATRDEYYDSEYTPSFAPWLFTDKGESK